MSKYHNYKTTVDGIRFDSQLEAKRYSELKIMEKAGAIQNLERQFKFELQESFKKNGKTIRAITYVADFVYYDVYLKKVIVEDAKGMETDVYKLKKKMFEYKYPDLEITEIRR